MPQDFCASSRIGLQGCVQLLYSSDTATRTVFGDVMKVVAANDNCTGHLGRDDASCENAAAD